MAEATPRQDEGDAMARLTIALARAEAAAARLESRHQLVRAAAADAADALDALLEGQAHG